MVLILFQNCKTEAQSGPPTAEEIAKSLEEGDKIQKKLETELRLIKDLDEGMEVAKKEGKPILLIFTGFGVPASRLLEMNVILANEKIFSLMRDKYINVWLYTDDRRPSGKKWSNLQINKFKGNYQPQIFVLDAEGTKLDGDLGYEASKTELLPLLEKYTPN